MRFIKVSALPCNADGVSRQNVKMEFYLNIDFIGGINGRTVYLKKGKILELSGSHFKDILLVNPSDVNNI